MAENETLEYFDFILPSNYEGMVALLRNEEPFDNKVCLGLKQNVIGNDRYNNADNSLIELSDNVRIFAFLTPSEFEYSQKEMLDHGDFLEDDYIEPAKEILVELDSKNGKTFYEADRNVLDYTVAARTKNKLHEPIASFVKDYQPIGLKFRFSADTGKDPLLYGLCSGNQNVKNTLLQAIQQDIQKAAPTTVRYNQKDLER